MRIAVIRPRGFREQTNLLPLRDERQSIYITPHRGKVA